MSGRVCEKHGEWCESGVCRWCEPLDPVGDGYPAPGVPDGSAVGKPIAVASIWASYGLQAQARLLAAEAEEKRKLRQAADEYERKRSGMVAMTYPAHDFGEAGLTADSLASNCLRCGKGSPAGPVGPCYAVEYKPDPEGRARRMAEVRAQLVAEWNR